MPDIVEPRICNVRISCVLEKSDTNSPLYRRSAEWKCVYFHWFRALCMRISLVLEGSVTNNPLSKCAARSPPPCLVGAHAVSLREHVCDICNVHFVQVFESSWWRIASVRSMCAKVALIFLHASYTCDILSGSLQNITWQLTGIPRGCSSV